MTIVEASQIVHALCSRGVGVPRCDGPQIDGPVTRPCKEHIELGCALIGRQLCNRKGDDEPA